MTRKRKSEGPTTSPQPSTSPEVLQILSQQQSLLTSIAQLLAAQHPGSGISVPPPTPSINTSQSSSSAPPQMLTSASTAHPPVVRGINIPILSSPENLTIPQFRDWKQRWEDYSKAHQLHQQSIDTQHGIVRSALDPEWTILWNSGRIQISSTFSVTDIITALEAYLRTKRNPLLDRQQFHVRDQMTGESVDRYYAALKTLDDAAAHELQVSCHQCSSQCPSTCSGCHTLSPLDKHLQEIRIRDRLICGLQDKEMQKRVLSEPFNTLTLNQVLTICTAVENSNKTGASLASSVPKQEVFAVKSTYKQQQQHNHHHSYQQGANPSPQSSSSSQSNQLIGCYNCGHPSTHPKAFCNARSHKCEFCGKMGHFRKMCFSEQRSKENEAQAQQQSNGQSSSSPPLPVSRINTIHSSEPLRLLPITTVISNSAHSMNWLPDTGSTISIISQDDFRKLDSSVVITPAVGDVVAADGKSLVPVGTVNSVLHLNGKEFATDLTICQLAPTPVLSKEGCVALGLLPPGWPNPRIVTTGPGPADSSSSSTTVPLPLSHQRPPDQVGAHLDTMTGRGSRRSPLKGGHVGVSLACPQGDLSTAPGIGSSSSSST